MNQSKILLELVYNRTGIYVTNKNDCKKLSQLISDKKIGYLSESTLYRFFLYPSNSTKPYKNTLNILAQFCGFESWNHFLYYCNTNQLHNDVSFLSSTLHKIIQYFIFSDNFTALLALFESIEKENYKTKEYVGLQVIKSFKQTKSFELFMQLHGDNLFVRQIIIENLFDPNYSIPGYVKGLKNYLMHTQKISVTYLQDMIFAHTVLFRYYYLNNDVYYKEIGEKLYGEAVPPSDFDTIHLFPKTRYYAYKIWYLNATESKGNLVNEYIAHIFDWISNEISAVTSLVELNIIYQTFTEVLDNLDMNDFKIKIDLIYKDTLKKFTAKVNEYELFHNANGLLNLL